ncbi:hypothetical protein ACFLZN_00320 [Nanoarchaeota archaeon]
MIGRKDDQKAKALIRMSDNNLKTVDEIKLNSITASPILSISYEALREILEAMCLMEGYRVYSHEAYTAFLKEICEFTISEKFDRLRKLRNGVNYYGSPVSINVSKEAREEVISLCKILKKKYLQHFL